MQGLLERRQKLKRKFQERKKVFAAWTSLSHPSIAEIFSKTGVDFVGIDLEHSTISQHEAQRIIASTQGEGALCLPRIVTHHEETIKRLLDSGADGLIVPMVHTPQQAEQIILWMKYPPLGRRSFGVARAQDYGVNFDSYVKEWNQSSSFIVQIESVEGVRNVDDIVSLADVDGAMVGPYDISGSLGIPGQLQHRDVKAAAKRVISACKKAGKSCGTQIIEPNEVNISGAFKEGFTFVVLASDIFILWKWAEKIKSMTRR